MHIFFYNSSSIAQYWKVVQRLIIHTNARLYSLVPENIVFYSVCSVVDMIQNIHSH